MTKKGTMRKGVSKNFSRALVLCGAAVFAGCSNGNSSANSDYVRASVEAENAIQAFNNAQYQKALKLADSAQNSVREILEENPESDIALKIVTDADLRLGSCKYSEFKDRILPELKRAANPKMAKLDIAWAEVFSDKRGVSQAVLELGTYIAFYPNQMKALELAGAKNPKMISQKEIAQMLEVCLETISDSKLRVELAQKIEQAKSFADKKEEVKVAQNTQNTKAETFVDAKKFLANADKDAAMALYNLEASARLLKASSEISKSDPAFGKFQKSLIAAFENVKKISSKKLKNEALFNIVQALSTSLLNEQALEGAQLIKGNDELKTKCLETIAASYADSKRFEKAINVAKMLPDNERKFEGLYNVAISFANAGKFKDAIKIAKSIPIQIMSASCILETSSIRWASDPKGAAKMLEDIDSSYLHSSNLANFCIKLGISPSTQKEVSLAVCENMLAVIEKVGEFDKPLAQKWVVSLSKNMAQKLTRESVANVAVRICAIMLDTGCDTKTIQDYTDSAILKSDAASMGKFLADLGAYASLKGLKTDAYAFFKKSAIECKSAEGAQNKLYLIWQMSVSNFDKESAVEILGELMPSIVKAK